MKKNRHLAVFLFVENNFCKKNPPIGEFFIVYRIKPFWKLFWPNAKFCVQRVSLA